MSDLLEQFLTLVGKSTDHQQLLATAVQERDPVLHARAIEEMGSWEALLAAAVFKRLRAELPCFDLTAVYGASGDVEGHAT